MPFDFAPEDLRSLKGKTAFEDGLAAEASVACYYQSRGHRLVETRWRGRGGEIDLIFQSDMGYVFVEVKKARTHAQALERLSNRQLWRNARSAEDYLGNVAEAPFADMRLDLATVDASGQVEILENLTLY